MNDSAEMTTITTLIALTASCTVEGAASARRTLSALAPESPKRPTSASPRLWLSPLSSTAATTISSGISAVKVWAASAIERSSPSIERKIASERRPRSTGPRASRATAAAMPGS